MLRWHPWDATKVLSGGGFCGDRSWGERGPLTLSLPVIHTRGERIKLYDKIGATLLVLTIVTVAVSYVDLAVPLAIGVALIIAATKGPFVAGYFMHLIGERRAIYAALYHLRGALRDGIYLDVGGVTPLIRM